MVTHFFLKYSFYLASKTLLFQFFSYLCWLLFIFPISGMPRDYHHTSILLYLLSFPKKSHLSQDVKFSYMSINPKWISSAPTSPLNFKIVSSCYLTSPCECHSQSAQTHWFPSLLYCNKCNSVVPGSTPWSYSWLFSFFHAPLSNSSGNAVSCTL